MADAQLRFDDIPDAPLPSFNNMPDESQQPRSPLHAAIAPITDIPATYQKMINDSVGQMGRGVGQIESGDPWTMAKGAGNVALGGLGYVTAPINAPLHTIVGKPVEEATGSPLAGSLAEAGAGFALPVPRLPRGAAAMPEEAPFGVTLSSGEKAGDLAARQKEQQAIRSGDPHAQAWIAQRQAQLGNATNQLVEGIDPFGQSLADTPQDAGAMVSRGVQTTAAARKADVKEAYKTAQDMPGEVHAAVVQNLPANIKSDLSLADNPVIIDKGTTPYASQMIDFLDNQAGKLQVPNKADPFGAPPDTSNIVGVNLKGIDQIRKNLSQMRSDAFGSSPPGKTSGDARAAQAILNSFDDHIDQAVNSGMFTGDKSAVAAWNNARAANADYQSTFGVRKGDPASRVVQKIIGSNVNDPMAPGKVMDQIVGTVTNPSELNLSVANKLKNALGEQSPEWIAAKQGALRKIVQAGEGESPLDTGAVAQRLSKFLNSDMADVMFTPQEQTTLRSYADLMRKITMPKGSYFPSAPPLQAAMAQIRSRIGGIVGAVIGHTVVPIPLVGELAGMTVGSRTERALERLHTGISKQLPLVGDQMQAWSRAQSVAQSTGNPTAQRAALAATVNLQKALTPLGIDLKDVSAQGPGTAYGGENQQNVPGPPAQ